LYRRTALTIALATAVFSVALVTSDSRAQAQNQNKFAWDTGVVMPGPNHILRLTATLGAPGPHEVRFRIMGYDPGICQGGICTHQVGLQVTLPPVTLNQDETASFDIPNNLGFGLRGIVASKSSDVRVNVCIVDTLTGTIVDCYVVPGPSA
jgi:hypothetical protein